MSGSLPPRPKTWSRKWNAGAGNWPPAWVAYLSGVLKSAGFHDIHFLDAMTNHLSDDDLRARLGLDDKGIIARRIMAAVAELDWSEHESNTGLYDKLRQIERQRPMDDHVTRIEVRSDGEVIEELSFPPGRVIVGRSPDNEIYIKSKFVSRHHAQIVSDEEGCVIEDLNSTNGVFLGEKQIKK